MDAPFSLPVRRLQPYAPLPSQGISTKGLSCPAHRHRRPRPAPPLLWQAADTGLSPLDGSILSALIYIGVGASVVSFLAWSLAIERIGMVRAGIIYNSIPLFASLEATLFLGESITLPQMIGGVLIIGGICYASFGDLYAARRLLK